MSIVALNNEHHADLRVRPVRRYDWIRRANLLPVVVHEVAHVAIDTPVVFVKNRDTGQFELVAVCGLSSGENLLVNDGQWLGHYLPGIVRNNPFKLIADAEAPDRMMLGIDESSELVNTSDGERLFDDNGNESDYLKTRKESLVEHFENGQVTQAFVARMTELELLVARDLTINYGGDAVTIGGVYVIDEAKLNELPPEQFDDLRTRRLLPVIYAHLISLNQLRRLVRRRAVPVGGDDQR